jgi:hypothetical protein
VRRVRLLVVALVLLVAAGSVLALSGNRSNHRDDSQAQTTPSPTARPFAKLPSAEIARQAIAEMGKLRNFRAEVTVQEKHRVLQIDVRRSNGGECFGQVTESGQTLRIIVTKDHMFVRASLKYWRQNGSRDLIEAMTPQPSKWARFDDPEAGDLCDIPVLMDKLELDKKTLASLQAKQPAPFEGYNAVDLANRDDSVNIVVNVDTPHYILKITDYEGEVRLSDFDVPASVAIPRRGEFVPFRDTSITV